MLKKKLHMKELNKKLAVYTLLFTGGLIFKK